MVVGGGRLLPGREEKGRKEGTGGCFENWLKLVWAGKEETKMEQRREVGQRQWKKEN